MPSGTAARLSSTPSTASRDIWSVDTAGIGSASGSGLSPSSGSQCKRPCRLGTRLPSLQSPPALLQAEDAEPPLLRRLLPVGLRAAEVEGVGQPAPLQPSLVVQAGAEEEAGAARVAVELLE